MTNSSLTKINEFLKSFPKDEIIQILNNIDEKISNLHDASSKDFMYFNKLLKEYYSRVKEIAKVNNDINVFFRKDLSQFINQAQNINSDQQHNLTNIDSDINFMLDKLNSVYSSFDLLVVPFNNYKQNLITLKYLLANINLHLSYVNLPNKDQLKEIISRLNNIVLKAANNNEKVYEQKEKLIQEVLILKNAAFILRSKNNTEVTENLRKLEIELKKLDKEEYWPDNFLHRISTHSQNCFANMGEIITNLQYHDIIRQKMEHIQSSQKDLISGLSDFDKKNPDDGIENQLKAIISIPEITDIQVAQLLYTNKDYQTSIEKITSRLIEVAREMKELNSLYITIGANTESFQNLFLKQFLKSQKSYSDFNLNFKNNWKDTSQKSKNIFSQYTNFKNGLNDIFNEEKTLRQEINEFEKIIKSDTKNHSPELVKRLVILMSDLKLNSNSLKNNLNNITSQINGLNNIAGELSKEAEPKELPESVLTELTQKVKTVKDSNIEYSKTSLTIANEITEALKNINYYTFFENTVEEIVKMLNDINGKINYEELKKEMIDDSDTLNKIENLYTMKSERDIHNKLTESGFNIDDIFANNSEPGESDDNDIELF